MLITISLNKINSTTFKFLQQTKQPSKCLELRDKIKSGSKHANKSKKKKGLTYTQFSALAPQKEKKIAIEFDKNSLLLLQQTLYTKTYLGNI